MIRDHIGRTSSTGSKFQHMLQLIPLLALWGLLLPIHRLFFDFPVNPNRWMFAHGETTLLQEILKTPLYRMMFGLIAIVLCYQYIPLIAQRHKIRMGWRGIGVHRLRYAMGTFSVIIAYNFFAADINLYAGQSWYVDRFALMILAILVYVNPLFVLPFTIYLYNYNLNLAIPVGQNSHHHLKFVTQILLLFGMFSLLRLFSKTFKLWHFVVLVICAQGATYVSSAYGKLFLQDSPGAFTWLWQNQTVYLAAGAHISYNWWGWLPDDWILRSFRLMNATGILLNAFTLIAEFGIAFAFIYRRRLSLLLLVLLLCFHLGVFVTTGLLFRMWMIPLVLYVVLLILLSDHDVAEMYTPYVGLLSVFIMFSGAGLPLRATYAWWDTGIYVNMDYEIVTVDNESYRLAPDLLYPYEELVRGNFELYIDEILPITNNIGAGSYLYWSGIENINDPETVLEYTVTVGHHMFSKEKQAQLTDLISTGLTSYEAYGYDKRFIPILPRISPHYLSRSDSDSTYFNGQGAIDYVRITYRIDTFDINSLTFTRILEDEVIIIDVAQSSSEALRKGQIP